MVKNPQPMKTVKFIVITKKTTIATTNHQATAIHEYFKFIKCTTYPRRNRYFKTRAIFDSYTKTKHSRAQESYFFNLLENYS